jgi:hypothetical protein
MFRVVPLIPLAAILALAQSYSVTPLPTPTGFASGQPSTINNLGQVATTGYQLIQAPFQAFIGSTSGNIPIPLLSGWASSSGQAVNSSGQVAGILYSGTSSQAFIGTPAGSTAIPLPPGWTGNSAAFGVNDSGFAVGTSSGGTFIGTVSGSQPIALPTGWTTSIGQAVNNLGQVTGTDGNGNLFIGSTSGAAAVPLQSGWTGAQPCGINDASEAAGTLMGGWSQPFIATAAGISAIAAPPGSTTVVMYAGCINNSTMMVGFSDAGGWIWTPGGGTQLLTSLVPSGWYVGSAFSISDNGHILAEASFNSEPYQYVDLFPTGPPAALTLIYPANAVPGIAAPTLTWYLAMGATSYDVYFGTSPSPPLVANVSAASYTLAPLAYNTTYYWQVVAKNSSGSTPSSIYSFTTFDSSCSFTAGAPFLFSYVGGIQPVNVTAGAGCTWTPRVSASWLQISSESSQAGSGSLNLLANANSGSAQLAYLNFANQSVAVMQAGSPSAPIFNDVPSSDPYFDYVSLMSNFGITVGCQASPPLYCPGSPVTRAEMAVFIVRGLNLATKAPLTYPATAYFQDVPPSGITDSEYFAYVQRLAQLGITVGCQTSPALFCPDESIPQGEMAVFVVRAWMLANNITTLTYPTTPYFSDVPSTDEYFPFIQKMAQMGFWTGCGGGAYCENSAVTRGQMAPMILRGMLGAP